MKIDLRRRGAGSITQVSRPLAAGVEGAEEKPADGSEAIQRTVTNEGPVSSSSSSSSATCCTQPQNVANAEKHTTFRS